MSSDIDNNLSSSGNFSSSIILKEEFDESSEARENGKLENFLILFLVAFLTAAKINKIFILFFAHSNYSRTHTHTFLRGTFYSLI